MAGRYGRILLDSAGRWSCCAVGPAVRVGPDNRRLTVYVESGVCQVFSDLSSAARGRAGSCADPTSRL